MKWKYKIDGKLKEEEKTLEEIKEILRVFVKYGDKINLFFKSDSIIIDTKNSKLKNKTFKIEKATEKEKKELKKIKTTK